jgi:hypothetical protein
MTKIYNLTIFLLLTAIGYGQVKVDFENFNLTKGQFLNGSDQNGGFSAGDLFLKNYYDKDFMYWSGWSISASADSISGSFTNEFSAASGSGAEGSTTYAVGYGVENTIALKGDALGKPVKSLSINNSTYTSKSMKNGDAFAKKFGGISGNDKDFLMVTIRAWYKGTLKNDSVDFFLADYRFEDNTKDYIVKSWKDIDLSALGKVDSLQFIMNSSDVGNFGINTPTYFCIDNVITNFAVGVNEVKKAASSIFPNPASKSINVALQEGLIERYAVLNMDGIVVLSGSSNGSNIDVSTLKSGIYIMQAKSVTEIFNAKFEKL